MKARHPGTCSECGHRILVNEPIKRDTMSGQMRHVDCKSGRLVAKQERDEEELFGYEYG